MLVLEEVTRAVSGELAAGRAGQLVDSYAIDSRAVSGGELFFALAGPRHDGHDFLEEAFARGAAAAVVSRRGVTAPAGRGLVRTADSTRALQELAASVRARSGARVVGITGSGGKTTTKELTAAALATAWNTHRSPGNLNNTYGLPLALLKMPDDAEAAVLEMGMSTPGEMTRLTEIADPDVGAILNVSDAHRANFSSIEAIADAKGELFREMRGDAIAVVNAADPHSSALALSFPGRRVSFAVDAEADLVVSDVEDDMLAGVSFTYRHAGSAARPVRLRLYGRHNAGNAAAALAIAWAMGLDTERAARALEEVAPVTGRGVVERLGGGVVLVDETYNSNPSAMEAVLGSLAATKWDGRRVLACGDMLELGDDAPLRHREIGVKAARAGVGLLIAVGSLAGHVAAGFRGADAAAAPARQIAQFADSAEAAGSSSRLLRPGDLTIVKGSRGISMEKFADAVRKLFVEESR